MEGESNQINCSGTPFVELLCLVLTVFFSLFGAIVLLYGMYMLHVDIQNPEALQMVVIGVVVMILSSVAGLMYRSFERTRTHQEIHTTIQEIKEMVQEEH
jgi:uncharacterized membrane protein